MLNNKSLGRKVIYNALNCFRKKMKHVLSISQETVRICIKVIKEKMGIIKKISLKCMNSVKRYFIGKYVGRKLDRTSKAEYAFTKEIEFVREAILVTVVNREIQSFRERIRWLTNTHYSSVLETYVIDSEGFMECAIEAVAECYEMIGIEVYATADKYLCIHYNEAMETALMKVISVEKSCLYKIMLGRYIDILDKGVTNPVIQEFLRGVANLGFVTEGISHIRNDTEKKLYNVETYDILQNMVGYVLLMDGYEIEYEAIAERLFYLEADVYGDHDCSKVCIGYGYWIYVKSLLRIISTKISSGKFQVRARILYNYMLSDVEKLDNIERLKNAIIEMCNNQKKYVTIRMRDSWSYIIGSRDSLFEAYILTETIVTLLQMSGRYEIRLNCIQELIEAVDVPARHILLEQAIAGVKEEYNYIEIDEKLYRKSIELLEEKSRKT